MWRAKKFNFVLGAMPGKFHPLHPGNKLQVPARCVRQQERVSTGCFTRLQEVNCLIAGERWLYTTAVDSQSRNDRQRT